MLVNYKYDMLLCDLFEADEKRLKIRLTSQPTGETPVSRFMAEFRARTQESMFNARQRVFGMAVVELSPSIDDRENGIHIGDMVSNTPGEGSKALAFICDLADAHRVTLDLCAKGYAKTPTEKLVEWYGRYGFIPDETYLEYHPGDDLSDGLDMIRHPKAQTGKLDLSGDQGEPEVIKLRGFDRPH